jgi:hypothetical protein
VTSPAPTHFPLPQFLKPNPGNPATPIQNLRVMSVDAPVIIFPVGALYLITSIAGLVMLSAGSGRSISAMKYVRRCYSLWITYIHLFWPLLVGYIILAPVFALFEIFLTVRNTIRR